MINQVVLIGRLVRDVELRKTTSGKSTVTFSLAVNRMKAGESGQDVDFITCVAWNKTAENMEKYLKKGSLIGVEGRIQTRSYNNQYGNRVYVTEVMTESIQFLEPKNEGKQNTGYQPNNTVGYDPNETLDINADDLPF